MIEKFRIREASYCSLAAFLSDLGVAAASAFSATDKRGVMARLGSGVKAEEVDNSTDKDKICRQSCITLDFNQELAVYDDSFGEDLKKIIKSA